MKFVITMKLKRSLAIILFIMVVATVSMAQTTTNFESFLKENVHDITIQTTGFYFAHPKNISFVELDNDHLIIQFISKEKEHQYANEKDVIYTINSSLQDLSSINKESVSLSNWNDCEYGVWINLMKNIVITKQTNKGSTTNTDLFHLCIACRTQNIQECLYNHIRGISEPYLFKTPQSIVEIENCFKDLKTFFSTYKLKSSGYFDTGGYRRINDYEMKNVNITYKDMKLKISFVDYCADCFDNKKIPIEIVIPVKKCVVTADKYISSDIRIKSDEGLEYIENRSKTLIDQYLFYGDDMVVKQGCKLLNAFIEGVLSLNYVGPLGINNTSKKTKPKSDTRKTISNMFGQ